MLIYCCECGKIVDAELVTGADVYKHRKDLAKVPFWQCKRCKNFVGCHHKTKDKTRPLGTIPSKEIKRMRIEIHSHLDCIWKDGYCTRSEAYSYLSEKLGYKYHTGNVSSEEDYLKVMNILDEVLDELTRPRNLVGN